MTVRILTLFGEEIIPESPDAIAERGAGSKQAVRTEHSNTLQTLPPAFNSWRGEKQYYSIGEVASLFDVKVSTIRFWTTEFELNISTNRRGDRVYTPAAIEELKGIYHLIRERGFTISGAKAKRSDQSRGSTSDSLGLRQRLLQLRNQLLLIRNQLQ